ncbi:hypothetical protein D3C84_734990 [compost metagenome]
MDASAGATSQVFTATLCNSCDGFLASFSFNKCLYAAKLHFAPAPLTNRFDCDIRITTLNTFNYQ